ncbi:unnamed protein product [Rhodiola kirilowii]
MNNEKTEPNRSTDPILVSEIEVEFLQEVSRADYELEVYKGKIKDHQDAIKLCALDRDLDPQFDYKQINELQNELGIYRERIQELEVEREDRITFLEQISASFDSVKQCLLTMFHMLDDDDKEGHRASAEYPDVMKPMTSSMLSLTQLAKDVEMKVSEYQEMRKKERRQLESSVVSLTEENRDINTLLRVALVEKETVEKSLSRLKGNSEQKRVPLLQFAERGLHKVGFSFMMASPQTDQLTDNSTTSNASSKSDDSEYEDEVVSLASVVEKIMKNLRGEISQLRVSQDDARSDNERLQTLSEKQGQIIAENAIYIKQLEDREQLLSHNVEELLIEMKETEDEVSRWREACELEVKAGKDAVDKRDKMVIILQQELEKVKAALEISNNKLKLKEELANAAMAAQAAAEKSLQLADSRAAGLRRRIEELTRQLEETESQQRNIHRVRHICWPWLALKLNPIATSNRRTHDTRRRVVPEMQALLPG